MVNTLSAPSPKARGLSASTLKIICGGTWLDDAAAFGGASFNE